MQTIRCKQSGSFFFGKCLSGTWLIKQHAETQQRHVCRSLGIKQNLKRALKTMNSRLLSAPRVWIDVLCAFCFEYFGFRSISQPPILPLLFLQPFKSDPNIPTLVRQYKRCIVNSLQALSPPNISRWFWSIRTHRRSLESFYHPYFIYLKSSFWSSSTSFPACLTLPRSSNHRFGAKQSSPEYQKSMGRDDCL